jgi:branched-chain amino acid transport system substrate-binding protein
MGSRERGDSPIAVTLRKSAKLRSNRRRFLAVGAALGVAPVSGQMLTPTGTAARSQATPAAPAGDPILIGGVYNLTGGLSSLDNPARDGSLLAVAELNAAGGLLGRPVELVVEDGKTDLTAVTNATRKLIEEDQVVALVGLTDTSFAIPVADVAQDSAKPFLTVGATAPVITLAGDYVFMLPFGDNVQAAVGAEYAAAQGWTTCGLMLDDQMDFTKFLAAYFVDRFDDDDIGGQIIAEVTYATGDTDFSAQLTEIQNLDPQPQFLYISSGPQEIGTIVKQVRDLGIELPIVGGDGYDTPLLVELAGPAADGVVFATHQGVYGESPTADAFRAAFEGEYGTPPPSVFAALGYDGVLLMADAITRAGGTEPEAIRDALAATSGFEGITGTVTYEAGSRVPNKGCALIEVREGRFELIENVTPEVIPPAGIE